MTVLWAVYGAGGSGRGIMPLLREQIEESDARIVFVEDEPASDEINGHEIWSFDRFAKERADRKLSALAVANSQVRERLDRRCADAGIEVAGVTASSVIRMDAVDLGPGALLSPFVTLTSNIAIGRCFHANLYSYVEHDCVLGDYVTFAPGVRCNGNVRIGDHAYIGSGAIIRQGLSIGARSTVGMGAVVTKDVPAGITVVGNPARVLEKK